MIQKYNKPVCLLFLLGFLSAYSPAYGAVNLTLQAPTPVAVDTAFDVTVKASGTGTVAGAQIKITFDKTAVQIKSISPAADVTAGNTNTANTNGCIVLVYLDTSADGINAGTNPEFAAITFNAVAKGQTQLVIDNWSAVADTDIKNVTGSKGTADVEISDMPTLSVTPSSRDVPAKSGTTTFSVSNTTAGTMQWTAASYTPWIQIKNGSSGTNDGTITVSYETNTGAETRTGAIKISATDSLSGNDALGSPQYVEIKQQIVRKGDIDTSGAIDLTDAILTLKVLIGMNPEGVNIGADINKDGKIGSEDVIYVLQAVSWLRQ